MKTCTQKCLQILDPKLIERNDNDYAKDIGMVDVNMPFKNTRFGFENVISQWALEKGFQGMVRFSVFIY